MPNSKSAPTLDEEIQRLLTALKNHVEAAERHTGEAERIKARLAELLPPETPLLDLLKDDGEKH